MTASETCGATAETVRPAGRLSQGIPPALTQLVRDLAGGCREWCAEDHLDERRQERPVRGGSWIGSARLCRLANRFGYTPRMATVQVGLRLARELPT